MTDPDTSLTVGGKCRGRASVARARVFTADGTLKGIHYSVPKTRLWQVKKRAWIARRLAAMKKEDAQCAS